MVDTRESGILDQGRVVELNRLTPEERVRFEQTLSPEERVSLAAALDDLPGTAPAADEPIEVTSESIDASGLAPRDQELEFFGSADIDPSASLFNVPRFDEDTQDVVPRVEDLDTPQARDLPVPLDSQALRSVGVSSLDSIIEASRSASESEFSSRKQAVPISDRTNREDHYNTKLITNADGTITAQSENVGVKSKGKEVGKDGKKEITVTRRQAGRFALRASLLAANYDRMTPLQQSVGTIELFTDLIKPHVRVRRNADGSVREGIPEGAALANIVNGLSVYSRWNQLGDFNRFRNVANTLVDTARDLGYADKIPLAVTNNLAFINFGYSAHNLITNWDQMGPGQRLVGTLHAINQGSAAFEIVNKNGFLNSITGTPPPGTVATASSTTTGAAALNAQAGTTAASATATSTLPQGAGTVAQGTQIIVPAGEAVPAGFTGVQTTATGDTVAVASSQSVEVAATTDTSGLTMDQFNQYANYAVGAYYAYEIIDNWGQGGDANSRAAQASRGAAVGGSIYPGVGHIVGAIVGLAIGSINAGKSGPQRKRDSLRSGFVGAGIFEEDDNDSVKIELSDGSFYDVGVDGSGSRALTADGKPKTYARPDRIADRDKDSVVEDNELRPYDIDYTNDLDYVTSLATKGVNLLPVGGTYPRRTSEVDQINGYLTNAATSTTGREWTEDNFNNVMANVRGFYQKMGIENFEQGKEIADKMREDRLLSQDDYNALVLGFEFAFNNNWDRANQLLEELGRFSEEPAANIPQAEFEELEEQDRADLAGVEQDRERRAAQTARLDAEREQRAEDKRRQGGKAPRTEG